MKSKKNTVEELMLDEGFLDFCLHSDSAYRPYWEYVIEWNPGDKTIFEEAAASILLLSGNLPEKEILVQIGKIRSRVQAGSGSHIKEGVFENEPFLHDDKEEKIYFRSFRKQLLFTVTAALTIGLVIYVLPIFTTKKVIEGKDVSATAYNSKPGERRKVSLPDGSIVLLNSNSRITINGDFDKIDRRVILKGEAFFNVAKDPSKLFIAESGPFSTTAIGTSFYVHARNPERHYAVDLLEGKASLAGNQSVVLLAPGEQGVWDGPSTKFSKTNFDRLYLDEWINEKISFNKTPASEALQQLEKWYAVSIDVKSRQIKNKTITGTYANTSLDDVLKVICFSLSCKYKYVNDQVIIE